MNFKTWHKKLTNISLVFIWIYLAAICLTPTMITTQFLTTNLMPKTYLDAYSDSWQALYHGTLTVPILLTIFLYLILLYILKSKRNQEGQSESNRKKKKALASMTRNITIGTLVCYIPFIVFTQYNVVNINNGTAHEVLNTTSGVRKQRYIIVAYLEHKKRNYYKMLIFIVQQYVLGNVLLYLSYLGANGKLHKPLYLRNHHSWIQENAQELFGSLWLPRRRSSNIHAGQDYRRME